MAATDDLFSGDKFLPVPSKDYGPPHPLHHKSEWWPRAEKIARRLLEWPDVRQLGVFGRNGYFVNSVLFATVPLHEVALELWMRLSEADAAELSKNARASEHIHPVKGWMRLRVDSDDQVDEALDWFKRAYENAIKVSQENRGVPIEKVPEATALPAHKIPHGPRSGRFVTGLEIPGAHPQGETKSNMDVRDLP